MRFSTIVLLLTSSLVVFASKQVVLSDVSQRNVPLGDKTLAEFDTILNTVMRRVKSHVHVASWEELRVVLQRDIQRDLEHAIPQTLSRQYPNVAEQLRKASNEARQSIAQAVANGALNLATDVPIFFNQKISKYYATASLDIVPLVVQLTRSDHDPITIEAKICQHLLQGMNHIYTDVKQHVLPATSYAKDIADLLQRFIGLQLYANPNIMEKSKLTYDQTHAYIDKIVATIFEAPKTAPDTSINANDIRAQLRKAIENAVNEK